MNRTSLRSFIQRIHFYGGMFVGPFILVAALTGCLYAVAPTVEKVMYDDVMTVPAVSDPVSLEQQVQAAQQAHPGLAVTQVWPADKETDSTRVLLSDPSIDEAQDRAIFVDPANGQVIGDEPTYSGLGELPVRYWISQLHKNLHMGKVGELYSELAASWMWLLALGGAYLWWLRWSAQRVRKNRPSPRAGRGSQRLKFLRLHGVLGTWLLVAMLALSATGITWSLYAGNNVTKVVDSMQWTATPIDTALGTGEAESGEGHNHDNHAPAGKGEELSEHDRAMLVNISAQQADTVYATGRAEGLTGSLRLYPPSDLNSGWKVSERWTPWRLTSDEVSVDGSTGTVIARQPFSSLPLFSKLTSWGIYLHMGILFGLPLQILLLLTGLGIAVMTILGYLMWWKRRPSFAPGTAQQFSWSTTCLGLLFVATVGVFLPTLGVTLLLLLIVDVLVMHRKKVRLPRLTLTGKTSKKQPVEESFS
ncbi:PepSY-associated TM helix domain-containing protein [Corynebacterium urogenitale]